MACVLELADWPCMASDACTAALTRTAGAKTPWRDIQGTPPPGTCRWCMCCRPAGRDAATGGGGRARCTSRGRQTDCRRRVCNARPVLQGAAWPMQHRPLISAQHVKKEVRDAALALALAVHSKACSLNGGAAALTARRRARMSAVDWRWTGPRSRHCRTPLLRPLRPVRCAHHSPSLTAVQQRPRARLSPQPRCICPATRRHADGCSRPQATMTRRTRRYPRRNSPKTQRRPKQSTTPMRNLHRPPPRHVTHHRITAYRQQAGKGKASPSKPNSKPAPAPEPEPVLEPENVCIFCGLHDKVRLL